MAEASLTNHLTELARHMAWADATVWQSVMGSPEAAQDAKIGDTLYHIHVVQHVFLQAWTLGAFTARDRSEFPGVPALIAWGSEAHRDILRFLDGVSVEELAREFRMPWANHFEEAAKRPAAAHTLGESVLQAILHTQHHRGQVCMRLREIGLVPPTVDFIVWLWSGRPAEALRV